MKIFDMESVAEALKLFKLPAEDLKTASVIKAERLTPDSEAVLLLCFNKTNHFYVAYTEDYVGELGYIKKTIENWFDCEVNEFIKPKKVSKFNDTPGSRYYLQKDEEAISKWVKYAIADGFDYTFLAKITPNDKNDSYWAMTRLNEDQEPSPEVQKIIDQHKPVDPNKPFLETWKQKQNNK